MSSHHPRRKPAEVHRTISGVLQRSCTACGWRDREKFFTPYINPKHGDVHYHKLCDSCRARFGLGGDFRRGVELTLMEQAVLDVLQELEDEAGRPIRRVLVVCEKHSKSGSDK